MQDVEKDINEKRTVSTSDVTSSINVAEVEVTEVAMFRFVVSILCFPPFARCDFN